MKQLLVLMIIFMGSLCSNAQIWKVDNKKAQEKDFLLGISGGFDGFNYHGKNAYSCIVNPYGKLSFARYYKENRGFRFECTYHKQNITKSDEDYMIHDTHTITLFADDMISISETFFHEYTDAVWGWDFYYGLGLNAVNTDRVYTSDDVVTSSQRLLLYPAIHVGTIGRYQILPFLEGFADISYNFTSTNMTYLQHGTHHYMELGAGLIYRFSFK